MIVASTDPNVTAFDCGCIWRWFGAVPAKLNHQWEKQCEAHKNQIKPEGCTCRTVGKEDGATTCWQHHDCSDGSCTHTDGDE